MAAINTIADALAETDAKLVALVCLRSDVDVGKLRASLAAINEAAAKQEHWFAVVLRNILINRAKSRAVEAVADGRL